MAFRVGHEKMWCRFNTADTERGAGFPHAADAVILLDDLDGRAQARPEGGLHQADRAGPDDDFVEASGMHCFEKVTSGVWIRCPLAQHLCRSKWDSALRRPPPIRLPFRRRARTRECMVDGPVWRKEIVQKARGNTL
jgi:hypothetical protein